MRRTEGFSARYYRLEPGVLIMAASMLLAPSGYFDNSLVLAQGQAKAVDSMRPDRQTTEGVVIGALKRATNTFSWKGIPYAKPSLSDLRWRSPQEPEKHLTPLMAVNFCEICPQYIDHDANPATPQVRIMRSNTDQTSASILSV